MSFYLRKCTILLFCFTFLDAVKFRCDYSYYDIGWFKYHEIPVKWQDARLQCHLEGAILASPTTTAIRNIMKKAIGRVPIFTGIHTTFSKGQYYSIDGIPLSSIPHVWAELEPDNRNDQERCLALNSNGKLSDENCNTPRPYMCYRKTNNADVTVCGTPDTEYHFDTRTNKCYKFHTNPRNYRRAFFTCSAEGGHLAIINSQEESQVIAEIFAKYPAIKIVSATWKEIAYIGFHNWDESADWTTIHGQSLKDAGFTTFTGGQPDNATTGEYCGAVMRNGLLSDLLCESHYAFICEKSPNFPPVCDNSEDEFSLGLQSN